jgi:hypothetical protein
MKLADRTVEIHSRGIESSNQFTIAQTSKMFKILSDSLYSDKVMAVIRELSTNAYDAHVAAGNKNPFRVTLPTQSNPSFTVRDYGTGLSQQDMEELYTTYGASNKNDSNDFVGCLGLGSKSPFAYTKSFSTISYFNGTKYSYIAAMDEAGVPSLNLFDISPTKEPNGLEISFAVKNHDFHEFSTKAKRIYHYFKTRPIIEGGTDTTLNDHSYSHINIVIEGKGWKIGRVSSHNYQYPSSYNSPGSGVVAIMGNIAYPVDTNKIIGEENEKNTNESIERWNRTFKKVDVDNWKNLVKEILNAGLYLEIQFGIGELEMDVSREGLQYTKNVIKVLRERTLEIYMQLKEDMTKKLSECKSLVEAYSTYYNLSDLAGGWTAGAVWTDPSGKSHELNSSKDLEYKFKKSKQLYVFNWRSAGYRSRRLVYLTDKIHWETLAGRGAYYYDSVKKNGKMVFFCCDVKGIETAKKILTKYCNQNDCYAYLMVDSDHPEDSIEGFDDIVDHIGGWANVLNVSDYRSLLNGTTRSTRISNGTISKNEIFILNGLGDDKKCNSLSGNLMNDSCYLRELSDDLVEYLEDDSNEIVYVPVLRYGSMPDYPSIRNICGMSQNEDIIIGKKLFDNQKIFAIKSSAVQKLKDEGLNLVCFNEWFKKWATKITSKLNSTIGSYVKIMKYAAEQYESADSTYGGNGYWYGAKYSDRNIMFHIINIFGTDYRKYIADKSLCDTIDQWFLIEFFALSINQGNRLSKINKEDYFAHLAVILNGYGMNGIDPSSIRDANRSLSNIKQHILTLYNNDTSNIVIESLDKDNKNEIILDKLPKMADIRKNLKDGVDKSPMFKYIVGSNHESDYDKPTGNNPLKAFNQSGYYGKPAWFTSMGSNDNIENFKITLGNLI